MTLTSCLIPKQHQITKTKWQHLYTFQKQHQRKRLRVNLVVARSKIQETQGILKKKFSVSLEKDFILRFHIYFSASFAFYFLVSDTQYRTIAMVSFNIATLNFDAKPPLQTSFIKSDAAIAVFKNLKDGSLKKVSK